MTSARMQLEEGVIRRVAALLQGQFCGPIGGPNRFQLLEGELKILRLGQANTHKILHVTLWSLSKVAYTCVYINR